MRKLVLSLHLYTALAGALFVVVLGATGSVMAFEDQLDHLFHPHLFFVRPSGDVRPLAHLALAASSVYPGARAVGYGLSGSPDVSWYVSFPKGTVFVNQYTGEVLGSREGPTLLNQIHQVHLRLLAGDIGKTIVSWAGVALLFLILTGVYLWWPYKRASIAWGAPARRVWFDLHSSVGILSFVFLLLLTLTGIAIGFERQSVPLFYAVTRSQPVRADFRPAPRSGALPITPDAAIWIARRALPGAEAIGVNVAGPKTVYMVRLRYPEDLTPGGRSRVYVEPYSGSVLLADSSRTTAAGQRLVIANRAIHTGDIYGLPTKALMSLASLMAAVQAISGVMLWWKRR